MSWMMEENIKVFVFPKREEAIQFLVISLFHSPLSFLERFQISQPKFRSMIVLQDSLNFCKFVPYKLGTFSYIKNSGFVRLWSMKDLHLPLT